MYELLPVKSRESIPSKWSDTPIGWLLEYHNLGRTFDKYDKPLLLVGTCMDYRIKLNIPDCFAFLIRTAGANMSRCIFNMSYAIAVGSIRYIALIGHNDCGMCNLSQAKALFVEGLCQNAGWEKAKAEEHFLQNVPEHSIMEEASFVYNQAKMLSREYKGVSIVPMMYKIEDHLLYFVE